MIQMDTKKFQISHRIVCITVFAIAFATYLLTIEPTASFWDCGEFIASSYKLEIGHPPGNPVFQLFARFFTIFTDRMHAAAAINSLSALCSALTVALLYLTIVFFARRAVSESENGYSKAQSIAMIGSGIVGALAYCFSDTFWFSAVEAEVYSMSSLFTALVFWAMTKWYDCADEAYANRWIVLICFLMGLSIGVHLLNLLSIPAIVFMYFYKIREKKGYTLWELCRIFILSCLILGVLNFIFIPYLPKVAAYIDLFFVNVLGLPFNSGAAFFMLALLGGCFAGLFHTLKRGMVRANTLLLCTTVIIIGFSIFSIVIIRSSVKTPTNEYQPDNPFTLVRYLNREQYGSKPLIYGEYYGAPYEIVQKKYWTPLNGKYIHTSSIPEPEFAKEGKMFFPRMWDNREDSYVEFYKSYIGNKGIKVRGSNDPKPTFWQNLAYFFDYQMNWMYWRYFFWNFAGRQNDIQSPVPGHPLKGNWESGIGFIDRIRLGDQSDAPDYIKYNKGKNHYYMLPLLLGLAGIFWQYRRDRRGCWLIFLMFFMTGIAIVIYLNQQPYQARERDYAYAGSFYFFSLWIGMGVAAVQSWLRKAVGRKGDAPISLAVVALCLVVPALMACENWDDHDRSNRFTAVAMAYNILESVGENGILVTHGDNDTFPLWYAQEVEGVRTDVRIVNTSLLGTDWHYDQMKYAVNESAPLPLTVELEQYLYGTNEYIMIYDSRDSAYMLSDVMKVFKHPRARIPLTSGEEVNYIASRKLIVPVNKDNVLKYGILDEKYAALIPSEIVLTIPADKRYITKQELFFLDLLSNYQWDRPINLLNAGGDLKLGIKDYLMFDGHSYRFVPIKNATNNVQNEFTDPEDLYFKMTSVYDYEALKRTDWFVDYHNLFTFTGVQSHRKIFTDVALEMLAIGDNERAVRMLDMCMEYMPQENFPLDLSLYGFNNELYVCFMIEAYFRAGALEKASALTERFASDLLDSAGFFLKYYDWADDEMENCRNCLSYLASTAEEFERADIAEDIAMRFNKLFQ